MLLCNMAFGKEYAYASLSSSFRIKVAILQIAEIAARTVALPNSPPFLNNLCPVGSCVPYLTNIA